MQNWYMKINILYEYIGKYINRLLCYASFFLKKTISLAPSVVDTEI